MKHTGYRWMVKPLLTGFLALFLILFFAFLSRPTAPPAVFPAANHPIVVESSVTAQVFHTATPVLSTTPLFTATPTAIAPLQREKPSNYTINPGDTLSSIAEFFESDVESIKNANQINGDTIYAGQTLIIPAGPDEVPAAGLVLPADKYIVRSGDNLQSIAESHGIPSDSLKNANYMIGNSPLPGQKINIPVGSMESPAWAYSILEGNLPSAYPNSVEVDSFTLHYQNNTFPSVDPASVAVLVRRAVSNAEELYGLPLPGRFSVYAAGSLFEPPDQNLRGRSFSSDRRFNVLLDGTGDASDQQYIVSHEFTHLYMWNVFGIPSSLLLSEGAAVYGGMNSIVESNHLGLFSICKLLHTAGDMPHITESLSFAGHNYNLANYYTAGCFVKYLSISYGVQAIGSVYSTSNYQGVFGENLDSLEIDFENYLASFPVVESVDANDFAVLMDSVSREYQDFFPSFSPTVENIAKYLALDQARIELLKGNLEACKNQLSFFQDG